MIYVLTKANPEGTALHASPTQSSEEYADSMYALYLTDEFEENKKGNKPYIRNYRLHATNKAHSVEMALAYDVYCPKCGKQLKQVGRSLSYYDLGLYTCRHCNSN